MTKYKIKRFSFAEKMKGNPKIKDALIHFNQDKIDPELDSDPITKNLPKEMKSWLTFLYENNLIVTLINIYLI